MIKNKRRDLSVVYVASLLLFVLATILSILDGKRPSIVISLLIIVSGTVGFIRLMKKMR